MFIENCQDNKISRQMIFPMITHAVETYKPELKSLWKLCFEDSDEFIHFYFDKIYRNRESLVFLDQDHNVPVAFLQIIPYQIKIEKRAYNAGYISGVMTHPQYRKKGYMQQLLNVAFSEMKKLNYTFTFLIPQEEWLFDFYAKSGYEKAFPKSITEIDLTTENNANFSPVEVSDELNKIQPERLYVTYSKFLNEKTNVVLKTQAQFRFMLEDLFLSGGCVFYVENEGFALVVPEDNKIIIKELFYAEAGMKSLLLSAIRNHFKSDKAIFTTTPVDGEKLYGGMIKTLIPSNFLGKIEKNIYMSMMLD